MKKTIIMLFLCGIAFFAAGQGIYTPVQPTSYGRHELRLKADSAQHIPEKVAFATNTADTSAQIYYYKADSSVWAYSKARGHFKIASSGSIPTKTLNWYNIKVDGGADSTGVTDAASIIRNAINAGYKVIYIPTGKYKVNSTVTLRDSVTILGDGRSSVILTTSDTSVFRCSLGNGGNDAKFFGFTIKGTYAYTQGVVGTSSNQTGIKVDSARRIEINGVRFSKFKGWGAQFLYNAYCCATYVWNGTQSNIVDNCYFDSSYTGLDFGIRAEYNTVSTSVFTANWYALTVSAGNMRVDNNSISGNEYGFYLTQSTNGGHGTATGNEVNHNNMNLYINGVTTGYTFSNCVFTRKISGALGMVDILNSSGVVFNGGIFLNDTFRLTNNTKTVFSNQSYYTGTEPIIQVISGDAPTVFKVGQVVNSWSLKDFVNSKQVDFTHLNGIVGVTQNGSATSIKFGIGTNSADSAFQVELGAWIKRGMRLSGLPTTGTVAKTLRITSTGDVIATDTLAGSTLSGSGTLNYVPKWTPNGTTLGNSLIQDDGSTITIGAPAIGTTSHRVPLLIGGAGTTSSLTYKTTTGVGASGADHIFQVGNNGATEAMRILNNGYVGIGTAAPTLPLNIYSTGSGSGFQLHNSSTGTSLADGFSFALDAPTPDVYINNREATKTYFYNNGNPTMTHTSANLVGIGETTPTALLHMKGISGATLLKNQSTVAASYVAFQAINNSGNTIEFGKFGSTNTPYGAIGSGDSYIYGNTGNFVIAADGASGVIKFATGTTVPLRWQIDAAGGFSNTGSAATAYVHLKAGTATASTAPLKFSLTSAALNTTAEAGAVEAVSNRLYYTDATATRRVIRAGGTPTVAGGAGAGTSPTVSLSTNSTDMAGEVVITTDVNPAAGGIMFTVTYSSAYATAPFVTFSMSGDVDADNGPRFYTTSTTTGFTIKSMSAGSDPSASTQYKFTYHVIQ